MVIFVNTCYCVVLVSNVVRGASGPKVDVGDGWAFERQEGVPPRSVPNLAWPGIENGIQIRGNRICKTV
jgi:hypothetical protein